MHAIIQTLLALVAATAAQAHPHSSKCTSTTTVRPITTVDANAQLSRDLQSTPTPLDRARQLLVSGDALRTGDDLKKLIIFDFNGAQPADGARGGASKAADVTTYPFSTGLDISMTVVFLEPCGINTPHIHPRASEFLILVEGSNLKFGSVLENGLVKPGENQEIAGTLNRHEGTVFSQGSMHWQFNDGCERAVMVAALNSGNAGTSQIAQNFMSLNAGILNATIGSPSTIDGRKIEDFRSAIPANLVQDVANCLARCTPL